MSVIVENLETVREKIAAAAQRVGRDPAEIKLVAVTKTVDVPTIEEGIKAGITAIGENRVQEIRKKYPEIQSPVEWHLIGHLQTNKVKYIIDKVDLIHSLDRYSLAQEISKRAQQAGTTMSVLVQVNVAEEETKFGLKVEETEEFIKEVTQLEGIKILGLMTMAPYVENPEEVRFVFKKLKELSEKIGNLNLPQVEMKYLSMGMSNDYEVAIEEGANIVRVGSAIFGARNY